MARQVDKVIKVSDPNNPHVEVFWIVTPCYVAAG